ncbi:PAS domain-containing sensor histidine kinase [Alienimonas californiensis]|uniref:Blue-light photoreceptor n=1 Tax=Alienimonas californiensis TaxID=2527989 RepID=A0A517P7R3_9PLAN|nr:PAS domain-containing protein [Alienimonas californiensis]QDT15417.1 Blue-light photoreceptor [Alienimonas californiensis]
MSPERPDAIANAGSLVQEGDWTLLTAAIDSANSMIAVADVRAADQPLVFVNGYFCEFTGYSREEVVGRNCRFLQTAPGGRDADQPGVQRIRDAVAAGERCKVLLRNYKKDGTPFWNELYLSPVRAGGGEEVTHYVGVQNDVTEHLECERERLILAEAVRTLDESVIITGPNLEAPGPEIRFVNEAFERMTGYDWDEAVGRNPRMLQGPDTDPGETERLKTQLRAGRSFRGEAVNYRKDGERYVVQWTAAPVWAHAVHGIEGGLYGGPGMSGHSGGLRRPDLPAGPRRPVGPGEPRRPPGAPSHYVASQRDVTARRALEREVLEGRSYEQARIARDLHDGPAQDVMALKFLVAALSRQVGLDVGDPQALHAAAHDESGAPRFDTPQALAAHLLSQADDAANRVRQVARGLMPIGGVRGELTAALTRLAAERSALAARDAKAPGPTVAFAGTPADEPDAPDVRNELYHLAREAVGNAQRHSGASRIEIALRRTDGAVRLSVADDGVGMSSELAAAAGRIDGLDGRGERRPAAGGVGLRSMRYRAEVLGGSLAIEPAVPAVDGRPARGVRIVCTLSASGPPGADQRDSPRTAGDDESDDPDA